MPGSGLGLAIVRQVVTTHGGSVSASSPSDGGTIIHIELPIVAESEPERDGGPDAEDGPVFTPWGAPATIEAPVEPGYGPATIEAPVEPGYGPAPSSAPVPAPADSQFAPPAPVFAPASAVFAPPGDFAPPRDEAPRPPGPGAAERNGAHRRNGAEPADPDNAQVSPFAPPVSPFTTAADGEDQRDRGALDHTRPH